MVSHLNQVKCFYKEPMVCSMFAEKLLITRC